MKKIFRVLHICLIAVMVLFIFSNSAKSIPESKEQSNYVRELMEDILTNNGKESLTQNDKWILDNIRKLAHVAEYFVLSVLITSYVLFYRKNKRGNVFIILSIAVVATVDETVQIFSNRGPAITDVLIDCLGGLGGFLSVLIIYTVVCAVILKIKEYRGNSIL